MQQCIDEPYEGSFIKVKEYLYELIFVLYTKCSFSIMASVRQQQNKEKTKKYKRKLVYTGVAPFVTKGKDGSEVKRFGLQFDSEFVN